MAVRRVERVMGTVASVEVAGDVAVDAGVDAAAHAVVDRVFAWLRHVDATFSVHRPTSLVNRFARGEVALDHPALGADGDDLAVVLDRCAALLAETGGVFDAWSVQSPEGLMFDPSGYVKGWAIERAASIVRRAGVEHFCIEVGGDLAFGGRDADGRPWRVALRDPDGSEAFAAILDIAPPGGGLLGLATSGSYARGAHIVDPRTGDPSTEIGSATVLGPSIADADAYATALYVMGVEGLAWLAQRPGWEGCVITRDRRVFSTAGFDRYVVGWPVEQMVASN